VSLSHIFEKKVPPSPVCCFVCVGWPGGSRADIFFLLVLHSRLLFVLSLSRCLLLRHTRYVYDDAAHEMPYVDEYTHLDDEHYFAMEADHDAETAII
jgi:hypothetical protein